MEESFVQAEHGAHLILTLTVALWSPWPWQMRSPWRALQGPVENICK